MTNKVNIRLDMLCWAKAWRIDTPVLSAAASGSPAFLSSILLAIYFPAYQHARHSQPSNCTPRAPRVRRFERSDLAPANNYLTAPASRRITATSLALFFPATRSGVRPLLSFAWTSAPPAIRTSATSLALFSAAICKGILS